MAMQSVESSDFVSWPREVIKIVRGKENDDAARQETDILLLRLRELRQETAGMLLDIDQSIADAEALRDGRPVEANRSRRSLLELVAKIEGTRESLSGYEK